MNNSALTARTRRLKCLAAALALVSPAALAGPFVGIIPPAAVDPTLGVPAGPEHHTGKEYSDELDKTAAGVLDPQQNIMFDGRTPSGVGDTFDYANPLYPDAQVDAIAHPFDYLFREVVTNTTAILFSTRIGPNVQGAGVDAGAPLRGCGAGDPICFETTGGGIGTWATKIQVHQDPPFPINLDALEVFGPDGIDDATRYSLFDDFAVGCSIWDYDPGTGANTCSVSHASVAALFPGIDPRLVDIDALMVFGSEILFSLWPNPALPVGDNVWYWDMVAGVLAPLDHGGHLWVDGWLGLNIDALESAAAPEPGGLALLGLGALAMGWRRREPS